MRQSLDQKKAIKRGVLMSLKVLPIIILGDIILYFLMIIQSIGTSQSDAYAITKLAIVSMLLLLFAGYVSYRQSIQKR